MSKTILQCCNVYIYTAICNSIVRKINKFIAELHPIPVTAEVWHTVGVDLIGPLTETTRRNKYIITAAWLFLKWSEAAPLKDKKAESVAEFLFKCFTRHGCCKVKITDQ